MKALIVDILDKHVIVLDKKGNYLKIKNYAECQVGSEIDLKRGL